MQLFISKFSIYRFIFATLLSFGTLGSLSALTISPARLEVSGNPGETVSNEIVITNDSENTITLYTSSEDFEASGETGTPRFVKNTDSLSTWVKTAPSFTLAPNERKILPFTINIPNNADPGGHFAALFIGTNPGDQSDGQVLIGTKLGTLVLLTVKGEIVAKGGINDFTIIDGGGLITSSPKEFVYRFSNDGQDRINPIGKVTIRNTLGVTTDILDANPTQGNILPKSIRKFSIEYTKDPIDMSFFGIVKHQMSNFALGYYKATLDVKFGESLTDRRSVSYFVFPWQMLIIATALFYLIFITLKKLLKKYNAWVIKQVTR